MMIPIVGLVILVMFISDSAFDVKKTGIGGTNLGGDEVVEIFSVSLSICRFSEQKPHIHASYAGDSCVCFSDKKNSKIAKDQEHRFRGSIILTTNDCIVGIVSDYSFVLDDMIHGFL